MPEAMRRRFLREKEAAQLLEEFSQKLKVDIKQLVEAKKPRLEVSETADTRIFFINGEPLIALHQNILIPTLLFEKALSLLPRITVNMGAVPYICNGADVMAPGIVKIEGNFNIDDYVLIADERYSKPLSIAMALTDSEAARKLKHGKITKNIHYVGDSLWNLLKKA